jgi:hypothetical protein
MCSIIVFVFSKWTERNGGDRHEHHWPVRWIAGDITVADRNTDAPLATSSHTRLPKRSMMTCRECCPYSVFYVLKLYSFTSNTLDFDLPSDTAVHVFVGHFSVELQWDTVGTVRLFQKWLDDGEMHDLEVALKSLPKIRIR